MSTAGALSVCVWPLPRCRIWRQKLGNAASVFQERMVRLKSGADGDGSAYYGRDS